MTSWGRPNITFWGRPHTVLYVTPLDIPYQRLENVFCRRYENVPIRSNLSLQGTYPTDVVRTSLADVLKTSLYGSISTAKKRPRDKDFCLSDSNEIRTNNHLVRKQTKWRWVGGFESRCCHLNFRYGTCFEQGFPWHLGKL